MTTVRSLVEACLVAAGVPRVFGQAGGLESIRGHEVADPEVAGLFAAAYAGLTRRPGVALGADTLHLTTLPGAAHREVVVGDVSELPSALARAVSSCAEPAGDSLTIRLPDGLDRPVPDGIRPVALAPRASWREVDPGVLVRLQDATAPVILAGPGVVRANAVADLRAVAAGASVGVLNTWGAKGVFDWRSRYHLATAGLQASDFALAGLADHDLIVACGIDPAEAGTGTWELSPVVAVQPESLGPLAEVWHRPGAPIAAPPLRTTLGALVQEWWAARDRPLPPAAWTRVYAEALGPGGLVAADPGAAGLWVARTFPTTTPGSVLVPARPGVDGIAVAAAAVARLLDPTRRVLAVVDAPVAAAVESTLGAAAALGVAVPVALWGAEGDSGASDVTAAVAPGPGPSILRTAVDGSCLRDLIDAAGPVVAWTGHGDP